MAFCVVKGNISACICPNQRLNKVFYCSQIQLCYGGQIFDHASVSRILGLALLTLRKWPPMPAKMMFVFSVSHFSVKKQRVLYKIELFMQK